MLALALLLLHPLDRPPPRIHLLDGGLRIVILEDRALPLVSVQLGFRVGSADDAPSQPGLCHVARTLLEHRDDAALRLRAAGIRHEARTLRDACIFSSIAPPVLLDRILEIERQRLEPATPAAAQIASALRVAATTAGPHATDRLPSAPAAVDPRLLEALFPGRPERFEPGIVAASLATLSPTDLTEYLRRWFTPSNATLIVTGDVDADAALAAIRRRFADLPWVDAARRVDRDSPPAESFTLPAGASSAVRFAWLTAPFGFLENAAIDVLFEHLCNPVDGPLCTRLGRMGYQPRWSRGAWRTGGVIQLIVEPIDAQVAASRPATTVGSPSANVAPAPDLHDLVRAVLSDAATRVPTEIEFDRARSLALIAARLRHASFTDRAAQLALHELIAGEILLSDYDLHRPAGVTVGAMQNAARALLAARCAILVPGVAAVSAGSSHQSSTRPADDRVRLQPALERELLDSSAALALLAQSPDDGVNLPSPSTPPTLADLQLAAGAHLRLCRVQASPLATVRAFAGVAPAPSPQPQPAAAARDPEKLADSLSFRGILADPANPLRMRGPHDLVPQMLEIQHRLLPQPSTGTGPHPATFPAADRPRTTTPSVVIVGDIDPAELAGALQSPPDQHSVPQNPLPPTTLFHVKQRIPRFDPPPDALFHVKHVISNDHPQRAQDVELAWWSGGDELRLRVRVKISDQPRPECDGIDLDTAAWLLGAADPAASELDGLRRWRWTCRALDPVTLVTETVITSAEAGDVLASLLRRIDEIQRGDVPRDQLETALRLARSWRLIALDSDATIADAVERGFSQPWNLHPELRPAECLPAVASGTPPAPIRVEVIGGAEFPASLCSLGDMTTP